MEDCLLVGDGETDLVTDCLTEGLFYLRVEADFLETGLTSLDSSA
jgi:hypothetical protein